MIDSAGDQVTYQLVFDIAEAGFRQWWFGAFGLVFVVFGILLVAFRSKVAPKWPPLLRRGFVWFFLGFSVFWTAIAFGTTYLEYARLLGVVRSGGVLHVEGAVKDFVPMPYAGHVMESFSVQGKTFEYSDYVVTSGFNNTSSHDGPIRAGRLVRIGYVGDTIVRLEVAE